MLAGRWAWPCAAMALVVRSRDINDDVAREAPEKRAAGTPLLSFREVLAQPLVLTFAAVVVLFHIANAAMLPLLGEELGPERYSSPLYMSAFIVAAQLVMIPVALASGRLADRAGRKPILLVGLAALVLRGLLFALSSSPNYLVSVEALDGIGTGVSGVLTILIISDLAKGLSGKIVWLPCYFRWAGVRGAGRTCSVCDEEA